VEVALRCTRAGGVAATAVARSYPHGHVAPGERGGGVGAGEAREEEEEEGAIGSGRTGEGVGRGREQDH